MPSEQQNTLPEFDDSASPPDLIKRIWAAKDVHFGKSHPPQLTYDRLRSLLEADGTGGPVSQKSIERARQYYPHLFPLPPRWPLRREDVRPWIENPEVLAIGRLKEPVSLAHSAPDARPVDGDGHLEVVLLGHVAGTDQPVRFRATVDPVSGALVSVFARLSGLAAAGMSAAALIDLADGRFDHAVRWCRVLADLHARILA